MKPLTSLGLVLSAEDRPVFAPRVSKPALPEERVRRLCVKRGVNPNRQRKGKSGEIPRTGGKGT